MLGQHVNPENARDAVQGATRDHGLHTASVFVCGLKNETDRVRQSRLTIFKQAGRPSSMAMARHARRGALRRSCGWRMAGGSLLDRRGIHVGT
jgi:hypothetical protein